MAQTVLVIPCYNEAARLPVETFRAFAREFPSVHLLFVNDGSTDDTGTILRELAQEYPATCSALMLQQNGGKGEAVRQGCRAAFTRRPQAIGYWDADLATPLEAVWDFRKVLFAAPERQLVTGARVQLLGRSIRRSALRHYVGRVFATCAALTLGFPIYDTQCGAKLFRASPRMEQTFSRPFLSRWLFDIEILARLIQGTHWAQLPDLTEIVYEMPLLQWHEIDGSKVRLTDLPKAALELARIYRSYLQGSPSTQLQAELARLTHHSAADTRMAA